MNEWELLDQLQTIKKKLDNNQKLTDREYKLFTSMMFVAIIGVVNWSFEMVLKIMDGDKNE